MNAPNPAETIGGWRDLQVPVVVLGNAGPLPRQELGRLIGSRVEHHLEGWIARHHGQGAEMTAQEGGQVRGSVGSEGLLVGAGVAAGKDPRLIRRARGVGGEGHEVRREADHSDIVGDLLANDVAEDAATLVLEVLPALDQLAPYVVE